MIQRSTWVAIVAILLLLGAIVYFTLRMNTSESNNSQNTANDESSQTQDPDQDHSEDGQNITLNDFEPIDKVDELKTIDLKKGEGETVPVGATVRAHYNGALASDGTVFQSSRDFGDEPLEFSLSSVIAGWQQGVPGMKVGGIRRLLIPASLAYGANPPPGSGIPSNADLVFDIEILSISQQ